MKPNALIIGSSGFLGSYFKKVLKDQFHLFTVDMIKEDRKDHLICNIASSCPQLKDVPYDIVVHNAGLAHRIPKNKKEANLFFSVNTEGFKNILASTTRLSHKPKCIVLISTVAVYGRDVGEDIDESHPRNSETPYGQSKIQAEDALTEFASINGMKFFILRLPLLIGTNAKGNLQKITEAISKGRYFNIKNNTAKKSAVLAEDVAKLLLTLPDSNASGIYNLTDSVNASFNELAEAISNKLGKKKLLSLPYFIVRLLSLVGDILHMIKLPFPLNKSILNKMHSSLTFSDTKARKELKWNPQSVLTFYK